VESEGGKGKGKTKRLGDSFGAIKKVGKNIQKGAKSVGAAANPLKILENLAIKWAPSILKATRAVAKAPRAVDVVSGSNGFERPPFVQEIIEKAFDSDKRWDLPGPIFQALTLFLAQSGLDLATCMRNPLGNGDTVVASMRDICSSFSPLLASHQPSVIVKSYTYNNKTSAPESLVMHIKKCESVSMGTWKLLREAENNRPCDTAPGTYCESECDPGVKTICEAKAVWTYKQCSTCCCKGGSGYEASVNMDMVHMGDTRGDPRCGSWFQAVEAGVSAVGNIMAKMDTIMTWGARCVKF